VQAQSPREERLVELERIENFPVAMRLLPRTLRSHLQAIYDVARVIDDTGDEGNGNRTAALIELRTRLAEVWSDDPPTSGALGRLVPTVRACALEVEPFNRLIEANLQDQSVRRYPRRGDLLQ
jgi:phytoene/squalene synthetase